MSKVPYLPNTAAMDIEVESLPITSTNLVDHHLTARDPCPINKQNIEKHAYDFLSGKPLFIQSASLKGPFDQTWRNPWSRKRSYPPDPTSRSSKAHQHPRKKQRTNPESRQPPIALCLDDNTREHLKKDEDKTLLRRPRTDLVKTQTRHQPFQTRGLQTELPVPVDSQNGKEHGSRSFASNDSRKTPDMLAGSLPTPTSSGHGDSSRRSRSRNTSSHPPSLTKYFFDPMNTAGTYSIRSPISTSSPSKPREHRTSPKPTASPQPHRQRQQHGQSVMAELSESHKQHGSQGGKASMSEPLPLTDCNGKMETEQLPEKPAHDVLQNASSNVQIHEGQAKRDQSNLTKDSSDTLRADPPSRSKTVEPHAKKASDREASRHNKISRAILSRNILQLDRAIAPEVFNLRGGPSPNVEKWTKKFQAPDHLDESSITGSQLTLTPSKRRHEKGHNNTSGKRSKHLPHTPLPQRERTKPRRHVNFDEQSPFTVNKDKATAGPSKANEKSLSDRNAHSANSRSTGDTSSNPRSACDLTEVGNQQGASTPNANIEALNEANKDLSRSPSLDTSDETNATNGSERDVGEQQPSPFISTQTAMEQAHAAFHEGLDTVKKSNPVYNADGESERGIGRSPRSPRPAITPFGAFTSDGGGREREKDDSLQICTQDLMAGYPSFDSVLSPRSEATHHENEENARSIFGQRKPLSNLEGFNETIGGSPLARMDLLKNGGLHQDKQGEPDASDTEAFLEGLDSYISRWDVESQAKQPMSNS